MFLESLTKETSPAGLVVKSSDLSKKHFSGDATGLGSPGELGAAQP